MNETVDGYIQKVAAIIEIKGNKKEHLEKLLNAMFTAEELKTKKVTQLFLKANGNVVSVVEEINEVIYNEYGPLDAQMELKSAYEKITNDKTFVPSNKSEFYHQYLNYPKPSKLYDEYFGLPAPNED